MDSQELLVVNGELPVAVIGCGEDFRLIRLDGDVDAAIAEAHAEGYSKDSGVIFAGVFAVVGGRAAAKWEPGLAAVRVMMNAAFAYTRMVADELKEQKRGESAEWLQRLWEIPDTRN